MTHKILIVEDDDMNRDMLCRRLQLEDYEVIEAADGLAALALARSELPDLILMDVSLPKMDGCQATRHLKGEEITRGIPVIMLTAHAMESDRQRCFEAGCDAYETKPVDWGRLMSSMEAQLNNKGSTDGIRVGAGCG
jgi:CheY-like chemotaxis protein